MVERARQMAELEEDVWDLGTAVRVRPNLQQNPSASSPSQLSPSGLNSPVHYFEVVQVLQSRHDLDGYLRRGRNVHKE